MQWFKCYSALTRLRVTSSTVVFHSLCLVCILLECAVLTFHTHHSWIHAVSLPFIFRLKIYFPSCDRGNGFMSFWKVNILSSKEPIKILRLKATLVQSNISSFLMIFSEASMRKSSWTHQWTDPLGLQKCVLELICIIKLYCKIFALIFFLDVLHFVFTSE